MMRFLRATRFAALAAALLSTFGVSCATAEVAVQTSHVGPVTAIVYHPETTSVLSGGSDGRIQVWDVESERIVRSLQTGTSAVAAMAVHPDRSDVAVVTAAQNGGYRLQIWDWDNATRRFSIMLEAAPLVLGYSPSGRFIVVSESRLSGMRYFDAGNGREFSYPEVSEGIVTYATVASSERTIMTYVAADGRIRYWNLADRSIIGEAETIPDLARMQVLENKRYAAAIHEGDLVVVDIVDGSLADRVPVGRVNYLTVARPGGQIVLLETRAEGRRVSVWDFDGEFLNRRRFLENEQLASMSVVTLAGNRLYGGSDRGELFVFRSSDGREEQLVRNVVRPIHDIALADDTLYVNNTDRIVAIRTDLFTTGEGRLEDVETVQSGEITGPAVTGPVNLVSLSDGSVLLWGTEGEAASILYRIPPGGETGGEPQEVFSTEAAIHSVVEFDETVLLLTRGDTLFQLSLPDFERMLRYSAIGMESVVGTEDFGLVVGKSRASAFESALLTINPQTRETVPLDTDTFLVFDLAWDSRNGYLYALGIRRDEETETTITRFSGEEALSERRRVFRRAGEFLDGSIAVDPQTGALYTSVGQAGITRVTGRRNETYGEATLAARRLEAAGGFVWSLNRDGSVSMWNPEDGERVGDLFFFEDGGWALVTRDGNYYASSQQAERFVAAVNENEDTRSFRLTVP